MAIAETPFLQSVRGELLARREKLETVIERNGSQQLAELLTQVDDALSSLERGNFGVCQVCHGEVEPDRLLSDPLTSVCLGCLSPTQQRALEHDLELAARIQTGLLPARDISVPGWEIAYHYRPAGVVGGDYCDVIPDDNHGLYFVIADVAGKGVAAAMLTSNLRAVVRALVPLKLPMQRMLAQANRLFCESKLPMQYATLIVGHSSSAGDLEIVNAGHLAAMILRGSQVQLFESNDLPLGLFCDQEFTVVRTSLNTNDNVVLYTDGLCEAVNAAGEEYGNDAIRLLLEKTGACCAQTLVETCRNNLEQFRGEAPRADDETLLILQYAGGA